jgi:hypothetical protein
MVTRVAGRDSVSISDAWTRCVHLRSEARYDLYLLYWYKQAAAVYLYPALGLAVYTCGATIEGR